jgi:hypothetical protein
MTARHVCAHAERGVEEQYSLVGPGLETAVARRRDAEVGLEFLENVA